MLRLALLIFVLAIAPASAHPGHVSGDAVAGFLHPFSGIDHVAAMLAVGAWSALIGGWRVWAWPLAFVTAMMAGGAIGHAGMTFPAVEQTIAASLVVFGILLAMAIQAPTGVGVVVIAVFAVFHGIAHGNEAAGANLTAFMTGFVVATGLLHLIGIVTARGLIAGLNATPVRMVGVATAVAGAALLAQGG